MKLPGWDLAQEGCGTVAPVDGYRPLKKKKKSGRISPIPGGPNCRKIPNDSWVPVCNSRNNNLARSNSTAPIMMMTLFLPLFFSPIHDDLRLFYLKSSTAIQSSEIHVKDRRCFYRKRHRKTVPTYEVTAGSLVCTCRRPIHLKWPCRWSASLQTANGHPVRSIVLARISQS